MLAPTLAFGCELPAGDQRIAGADDLTLSYRTDPPGLTTERHVALIVHVCARAPVSTLTVDAHMPDHRHGMNYKPSITRLSSGGWRAEGLLFHMPGKWELIFGVGGEWGLQRLRHTFILP